MKSVTGQDYVEITFQTYILEVIGLGFPQSLQGKLQIGKHHFLPNPCQFVIHLSSYHPKVFEIVIK
jgi:hypothetical protein